MPDLFPKPFTADLLDATAPVKAFATGTAARFLLDTDGVPMSQGADGAQTAFKIEPFATDEFSPRAGLVAGSFDNTSGSKNFVLRLSHNDASGNSRIDTSRALLGLELESHFETGGKFYSEAHVAHQGYYVGCPVRRPYSFFLRSDAAPAADSEYAVDFQVRQIVQIWEGTQLYTSNLTNGLRYLNAPIGTVHTDTAKDHLILAGPAGQTGKFLSLVKNSAEFARVTGFGELILDGASTGSGSSSEAAMLDVTGRVGTAAVANFATAGGTTRFTIDQTEGTNGQVRTSGQWYHSGQFAVRDNAGSNTWFLIGAADGRIYTNQTSATGAAGAVVAKMPIYNTSFALVGYVDIKALS